MLVLTAGLCVACLLARFFRRHHLQCARLETGTIETGRVKTGTIQTGTIKTATMIEKLTADTIETDMSKWGAICMSKLGAI